MQASHAGQPCKPAMQCCIMTPHALCMVPSFLCCLIWHACTQELIPYGLSVTNANISELRDMPGDDNRYFESLKQKAISGATNNARCTGLLQTHMHARIPSRIFAHWLVMLATCPHDAILHYTIIHLSDM